MQCLSPTFLNFCKLLSNFHSLPTEYMLFQGITNTYTLFLCGQNTPLIAQAHNWPQALYPLSHKYVLQDMGFNTGYDVFLAISSFSTAACDTQHVSHSALHWALNLVVSFTKICPLGQVFLNTRYRICLKIS